MAELRVSPDAEAELDAIWMHIARDSGIDTATRVVGVSQNVFGYWPVLRLSAGGATTCGRGCVPFR